MGRFLLYIFIVAMDVVAINNSMPPLLTQHFEEAARRCQSETKALTQSLRTALLDEASWPIALWEPYLWKGGEYYNCYNFALNTKAFQAAVPGNFSADGFTRSGCGLDKWHSDIHAGALRDGLIYLGARFHEAAITQHINPVALFLRADPHQDFHWTALRRRGDRIFWGEVGGLFAPARKVPVEETIFDHVGRYGYLYFGGYYGVPKGKVFTPPRADAPASHSTFIF